jgi:hypothetical protein
MKTFLLSACFMCACFFASAQKIILLEWFIDTDKGFGKNTTLNVTPSSDSNFAFKVTLSGVAEGFHRLYIRTKDSTGKWSTTARRNIEVLPSQKIKIIAGEYFFDTDPGVGSAKKITISTKDTAVVQNFAASTSGLKPGYHKLYARFKDASGKWSITMRRNVEIIPNPDTADVVSAEYFFDKDKGFGKATAITFAHPSPNNKFHFKISSGDIPPGADTLFVRVKDSDNKWSLTKFSRFTIAAAQQSIISGSQINSKVYNSKPFVVSVNPNPVSGSLLNVNIRNAQPGLLQLKLYSMEGKSILLQQIHADAGSISRKINVNGIAPGTYILYVSNGVYTQSIQFIKE